MNLEDVALHSFVKVEVPNGEMPVRGLSLNDITQLIELHRPDVEGLFSKFMKAGTDDDAEKLTVQFTHSMLTGAPKLVCDAIAMGTNQPTKASIVQKFPLGLQLKLIEAVVQQTAADIGGPGKLIEFVISAVGGMSNTMKGLSSLNR